jgi:DNA primase small subunit
MVKIPLSGFSYGWRRRIIKNMNLFNINNDTMHKYVKKLGGYSEFKKEIENIVEGMGVKIDPYVTMDIHRVFRMPGSINSKSGLSKIRCDDLDTFDPLSDACLFDDDKNVNLNVKTKLDFRFKRKKYNLDKYSTTVPFSVGVYLVLKHLADLI